MVRVPTPENPMADHCYTDSKNKVKWFIRASGTYGLLCRISCYIIYLKTKS